MECGKGEGIERVKNVSFPIHFTGEYNSFAANVVSLYK